MLFKVALIECGAGNVQSMFNALCHADLHPTIISNSSDLAKAEFNLIVLPGVGAFGFVMAQLRARSFDVTLREFVIDRGVPFLGVCVGMQVLAEKGYEFGEHDGLGWISAETRRLQSQTDIRLPHVGWNSIKATSGSFLETFSGEDFYFVHSNAVFCLEEYTAAQTHYGTDFTSAIQKQNIFGVQFHPEKSALVGTEFFKSLEKKVKSFA